MKFRCERDVLTEALGIAGRAVGSPGSGSAHSGIHAVLEGDKLDLTGSDLDLTISMSVQVSGQSDGKVVIPARLAADIVKSLGPGAVSVAAEGDELSISSGRSEFSIRLITSTDLPSNTDYTTEPLELPSASLADAFRQVVIAASSDDSRPILTGVLLTSEGDGLRLVATDSYRLAMRDLAGVSVLDEGQNVLVPGRALSELNRILGHGDSVRMQLGANEASFAVGPVSLRTRLIEGSFPNYQGLIPDHHSNTLTLNRAALLEALKRVKLLAKDNTPVRLEMSADGLELAAIAQDVGAAREQVEAEFEGEPLTVAFNPQYLQEGAEAAPGDVITLSTIDNLKPSLIRSPDVPEFLYLLMPVRVS